MRCPSCEKFVSYDTDVEPEGDLSVEDSRVTGSIRRVLSCADCGEELKQAEFDVDLDIRLDAAEEEEESECADDAHEWEIEDSTLDATSRMQTTDRRGKPIKRARYMKMFYGVDISGSVKCRNCEATGSFSGSEEVQASGMEELA